MRVKEAEGALEGTGGGALNEEDQEEEEGVFFPSLDFSDSDEKTEIE